MNYSDSAFALLAHPIQRALRRMAWTELRPLQVDAIRAVLQDTGDLILMADTAAGKTEAAFLPVLSALAGDAAGSLPALYVGPLKALINDQFRRQPAASRPPIMASRLRFASRQRKSRRCLPSSTIPCREHARLPNTSSRACAGNTMNTSPMRC